MARVNHTHPVADVHGALAKGDKVIFRVRDGIQQAYAVKHPYDGEPSEKQTNARSTFRALTTRVRDVYADPVQLEQWEGRFKAYTSTRQYKLQLRRYLAQAREPQHIPYSPLPEARRVPKPVTTLYGFIMSTLARQ